MVRYEVLPRTAVDRIAAPVGGNFDRVQTAFPFDEIGSEARGEFVRTRAADELIRSRIAFEVRAGLPGRSAMHRAQDVVAGPAPLICGLPGTVEDFDRVIPGPAVGVQE